MSPVFALAIAQAAVAGPAPVTPVTLARLADDFQQLCVAPNGDAAAMKAAAEAYQAKYPGSDRPSYSAMANKRATVCFVFTPVVEDATVGQVQALATNRFGAPARGETNARRTGTLAWASPRTQYQAELSDQDNRHVALFSASYAKEDR
jgi:hypothetical protein